MRPNEFSLALTGCHISLYSLEDFAFTIEEKITCLCSNYNSARWSFCVRDSVKITYQIRKYRNCKRGYITCSQFVVSSGNNIYWPVTVSDAHVNES